MTEENSSAYEIMVILDPNLGEEATNKEIEKIKKYITDLGGKITHEDFWGLKNLSYRIRKEEKGFYVVLNFNLESEKQGEFKAELALEQAILRYLITKTPKNYEIKTYEEIQKEAEEFRRKPTEGEEEKEEKSKPKPKPEVKPEPKEEPVEEEVIEEKAEEPEVETEPEPESEVEEEQAEEEEVVEEKAEEPEVETEPEPEAEVEEEPAEEEEVVEEKAEEPAKEKESKPNIKLSDKTELEDVDAKLRSIIDDPDISL